MLWTVDKGESVLLCCGVSGVLAGILSVVLGIAPPFLLTFTIFCCLTIAFYIYRAGQTIDISGRVVLITGCDSGFGLALALHLHNMGVVVVAGVLQGEGEGARRLRGESSDRLHVLPLDITKPEQLTAAAERVKELLPKGEGLWGLVNNAGVCSLGPVEWLPLDAFRRDVEINLFGLVASTKTFLPFVRQAKGRVVSIASVAGRVSCGFLGAYSASKYAVEGFNDALRHEMRPFGVKVSLVEPGNYANGTNLFATDEVVEAEVSKQWDGLNEDLRHQYGQLYRSKVQGFMKNFRRCGAHDISPVLNALTEGLTQEHPQARYCPMTPLAHMVKHVSTHLPEGVYDGMVFLLARFMIKPET